MFLNKLFPKLFGQQVSLSLDRWVGRRPKSGRLLRSIDLLVLAVRVAGRAFFCRYFLPCLFCLVFSVCFCLRWVSPRSAVDLPGVLSWAKCRSTTAYRCGKKSRSTRTPPCCTVCLRLCQASAVQRRIMLFALLFVCRALRFRSASRRKFCRVGTGIHVDPIRIRSTLHGALGQCQPNHVAYHVHHRSVGDGSLFPAQYWWSGAFASGRSCVGRVGCILVVAPMQTLLAMFVGVACVERVC